MRSRRKVSNYNPCYFIAAILLGMVLAVGGSVWATTIGSTVSSSGSVAGTLFSASSASATSTFSGLVEFDGTTVMLGDAQTDRVNYVTGELYYVNAATSTINASAAVNVWSIATSTSVIPMFTIDSSNTRAGIATTAPVATFAVGAAGSFYAAGNVTFGDAAGDTVTFNGDSMSYTLAATSTITGDVFSRWSIATSTTETPLLSVGSSGGQARVGVATATPWALLSVNSLTGTDAFAVGSSSASTTLVVSKAMRVGIGTSTPGTVFSVDGTGDVLVIGTATSAVRIHSSKSATGASGRGGCLELEDVSGNVFRLVASTSRGPAVFQDGGCY